MMKVEFDPAKNEQNQKDHNGLRFEDAHLLNWNDALVIEDGRKDYGETRYRAFVYGADKNPCSAAFTIRGESIRIISFRRARKKERKLYDEK